MLTKNDLNKIGNVIDGKLDVRLKPIIKDLGDVKKDLGDVKKRVRKTEKTVNLIAKNYDEGDVMLARRVKKLEQHAGLPTGN